jgi:hypothetical protein
MVKDDCNLLKKIFTMPPNELDALMMMSPMFVFGDIRRSFRSYDYLMSFYALFPNYKKHDI